MKAHATGNYNVAVGYRSMKTSNTGHNNTAFGAETLENMTTGRDNTAIGVVALRGTTEGDYNIGLGSTAGVFNTTGSHNIAIGYASGPSSGNLDNTICIGKYARATASNTCIIGADVGGIFGSNSVKVGIGTDSPGAKLEINGTMNTTANTNPFLRLMPSSTNVVNNGGLTTMFLSITEANNYGISLSALRKTNINEKACFVIKTHHNNAAGVDAFLIDGDGKVGIGTTNPIGKLQVAESSVDGDLDVVFSAAQDGNCSLILQRNHGTENADIGGDNTVFGDTYYPDWRIENFNGGADPTNKIGLKFTSMYRTYPGKVKTTNDVMVLNYEGNVGIGTESPQALLHIIKDDNSDVLSEILRLERRCNDLKDGTTNAANAAEGCYIGMWLYDDDATYGNRSEVARISYQLGSDGSEVSGRIDFWTKNGSLASQMAILHNGTVQCNGDIVAFHSSDKRLKTKIKQIQNPLEKLEKINGYTFEWIEKIEIHSNKGNDIGVIAQEVEEVLPEIVTTRDNGYKAVRYEKLTPFLISCIKEQQKQIESQQQQIESQQQQIESQQQQINELKEMMKALLEKK
tara:strand:- start:345 stop:2066 length:1722 start_codon:yes stop_codon:yes gene_type:complete